MLCEAIIWPAKDRKQRWNHLPNLLDLVSSWSLLDDYNLQRSIHKTYKNIIKRLQKDKFKFPIKDNESLKYVTQFLNEYPKLSTQLDLLNVIIIIRQELDKPVEKLKNLRMVKKEDRLEENITTMKDLKDNLMSVEDFENQLNQSFDNSNFTKYVLNYLMFQKRLS